MQVCKIWLSGAILVTRRVIRGGFNHFVFNLIWGDDPIWRAYFSNGLKPTSPGFGHQKHDLFFWEKTTGLRRRRILAKCFGRSSERGKTKHETVWYSWVTVSPQLQRTQWAYQMFLWPFINFLISIHKSLPRRSFFLVIPLLLVATSCSRSWRMDDQFIAVSLGKEDWCRAFRIPFLGWARKLVDG